MTVPPRSRKDATLSALALELGGARKGVVHRGADVVVTDVQQDSRRVRAGDLFVSRPGSSDDARRAAFLADAVARGAAAVLREHSTAPCPVPVLEVAADELRAAIGVAASAVHGHPSYALDVVAVTGTNGKTTTTSLIAEALDRLGGRCARIGTVGAELAGQFRPTTHTTPEGDELARLLAWAHDHGATAVAMEASSHALEQRRLEGTRVRVAGFTNLTQDHLDYHHTMEAYFAAKRRLFVELSPGGAVVCVDDPWGARLAEELGAAAVRVSTQPGRPAEIETRALTLSAAGIVAELAVLGERVVLESPLLGAHNLENLLVSLGVLVCLEHPAAAAALALGAAHGVRGRLERASGEGDPLVLVDYAHTPDALERVLATLRPLTEGRLFCVFGCGGDRDPGKRPQMGHAVSRGADVAVVTSDNPRTEDPGAIIAQILPGMTGHATRHVEPDRAAAIAWAVAEARVGDAVLVAGKGHEDYQIVGTEKRPFDDVVEAKRALVTWRATWRR